MKKIAKPILELSNICRADKKSTVDRLSLSVPAGDCFAVLYKNSDNISLLTEILSGRVSPKKGKIFFKGDDVTGTKNIFGVVKKKAPFPRLKTVADFAGTPIVKRGLSRSLTDVLVRKEIRHFGLDGIADDSFSKLSAQTAVRALIFAAYMCSHEFMVIDEPFSQLDDDERRSELDWLDSIRRGLGISMLIFTEDIETAIKLADYVMVVDKKTCSTGIIAVDKGSKDKARERIEELYAAV